MENKKVFIVIDERKFGRGLQLDVAEIDTYTGDKKGLKSFSVNDNVLLTQSYHNAFFIRRDEGSSFFIDERNKNYRAYENYKDALNFIKFLLDVSIANTIKNIKASEEKLKLLNDFQNDFDKFESGIAEYEDLDEELFFNFNKSIYNI